MSQSLPSNESSAWRLVFLDHDEIALFGLPNEAPWPGEWPDPDPEGPFPLEQILKACSRAQEDSRLPEIWKKFPSLAEAMSELGHELESEKWVEIARVSQKISKEHPCPAIWNIQARIAMERNDLSRAIQLLKKAANAAPSVLDLWIALGQAQEGKKRNQDAIQTYRKASKAHPDRKEPKLALVRLGVLHPLKVDPRENGEDAEIIYLEKTDYSKHVTQQADEHHNDVGWLLALAKEVMKARVNIDLVVPILHRVTALDPAEPKAWGMLIGYFGGQGAMDEAHDILVKALDSRAEDDFNPDWAPVCFMASSLATKEDDYDDAEEWIDLCQLIDPDFPAALKIRIADNRELSRSEKETLLREHAQEHESANAAMMAANFAYQRNDYETMLELATWAQNWKPDDERIRESYLLSLLLSERPEKLAAHLKPIYGKPSIQWQSKHYYACALHEMGLLKEAIGVLNDILQLPDLPQERRKEIQDKKDLWTRHRAQTEIPLLIDSDTEALTQGVYLGAVNGEPIDDVLLLPSKLTPSDTRVQKFPLSPTLFPVGKGDIRLSLQQGQVSATGHPKPLGSFVVKEIDHSISRTTPPVMELAYLGNQALEFTVRQGKRRLHIRNT